MRNSYWVICHLITSLGMVWVISVASKNEFINDLSTHNSDILYLIAFLYAGYLLTQKILQTSTRLDIVCISLSSLYFFSVFCMFSDGHFAGWAHSSGVLEKLFIFLFCSLAMLQHITVPLVALLFAAVHYVLLKVIWQYLPD